MKKSGFTLIEIMIVISIMALLFSFSYASYREFQRRQVLNQAALMVITDLRLTQQLALSGRKEPSCNRLEAYTFNRFGDTGYTIEDDCTGGGATNKIKTVVLPPNITINPFPTGNDIKFLVLAEGIGGGRTEDVIITLVHNTTTETKQILVTLSGEIKEL